MEDCVFCNLIKYRNNCKNDFILYEDNLLAIKPAEGSPIRGYLMIIPKRHVNGFAELSEQELIHVQKVLNVIKGFYREHFHINSILLEHGSTSQGRHPQSIVHAHIHLIPFNFNNNIENELITELKLKTIQNLEKLIINKNLDYWMYCNPSGQYYTSVNVENVPRSIFMNLIAKQINLPLPYEWRKTTTKTEYIDEIIEVFNKYKDLLKIIY